MALAKQYECSVCKELNRQVPRPRVSLEPLPPKWNVIQVDNAQWTHPKTHARIQLTIMINEGSRFRVGKVMREGPGGGRGGSSDSGLSRKLETGPWKTCPGQSEDGSSRSMEIG